jgi:hypothetical protein
MQEMEDVYMEEALHPGIHKELHALHGEVSKYLLGERTMSSKRCQQALLTASATSDQSLHSEG